MSRADIPAVFPIRIGSARGGLARDLPIREVRPGLHLAILTLAGDPELTEAAGQEIAARMPPEVEALVTPDGKAQALLHVVQRETGIPFGVLLRKERKSYLAPPVLSASSDGSITTPGVQTFHLGSDDATRLRGRVVAIVEDVVSSGRTIRTARRLLEQAGVAKVYVVAVATEGDRHHPDFEVAALAHLPIYSREVASP